MKKFFVAAGSICGVLHAVQSSQLQIKKQYGVYKSPLGAFKATRQISKVLQGPGSTQSVQGR